MYDIVIKNGLMVDGTGSSPIVKDIGISGEIISEIGGGIPESSGRTVIDAKEKIVVPGFVDITSHSDVTWTIFDYPGQESLLTQGVTTIIGGNCGSSLAPLVHPEAIKSIQKWTDLSKINTNWATLKEFLDELSKKPIGVNFGTLIGHGTLRRGVIGEEIRPLNLEEIEKIKLLVRGAMKDGAFGFSTGLGNSHEQPATADEVINFVRIVKEYGGVYKTHLRSEGREGLLAAINETIKIGRETETPVLISHLKAIGRKEWQYVSATMEMIKNARNDGILIAFDVYPYLRTGSHLYQLLPRWAREGGFTKIFGRLKAPDTFAKIVLDMQRSTLHYDRIIVSSAKDESSVGKTIGEISRTSKLSPEETIAELLIANEGRVSIFNKNLSKKNLVKMIMYPESSIASNGSGYSIEHQKSGSLVHPRSFGAFVHFLHYFVMVLGKLSWEEAVQKVSSRPAQIIGLKNRGILAQKYYADIAVLDPERLADNSTYTDPYQYSSGVDWVMVNGKIAVKNGELTGIKAGKFLKK